ncbi:MAG TPA: outer membrane lipoprotein carrier protein LolA [Bacteroidales bacterium]|nr:outer membrane lipoprotein carrier protein LolA [Bacteroidales bacterium]HPF04335.1 outer membrane lipoprotein carrier protein LolA [Bacteroidales bacterium]HPJ58387.1 outer membrane lipoprotein carrier protein LolA [Bacteroidales bacterium]HPR10807.1 outer membrane lipoprotein carrier protein LolA [Bacteroidales bacterium]HRW85990.1 outer membrane lipoprotein carrier protein LolA [Bacteroidales bacterium]
MKRTKYIALFYLLLWFVPTANAQEKFVQLADTRNFMSGLEKMSALTNTIESDFVQEKNLSVLAEKIISKGHFRFRRENNIRWEYTQPYKYLIIISNGQLYTRDERNRKVYDIESNRMFSEMNRFIGGCIRGDILKDEEQYSTEFMESADHYLVKLVPRNDKMRQMLNEVHIMFDKKDFSVTSIRMVESGEDYTKIDFVNKKLNTDIPLEKFSF